MSTNRGACPFCRIVADEAPADIVKAWPDAIAIVPLNPVTKGHLLVIPTSHVADFSSDPAVSGMVMARAAELAQTLPGDYNLITSRGVAATQSVYHCHLHLIPRRTDDGLALPWYSGKGGHRGHQPTNGVPCRCGHTEDQHIAEGELYGPQCKVCPGDDERSWRHPYTPEED